MEGKLLDEDGQETWVTYAGALEYLVVDLEAASSLLTEVKTSNNLKPINFLSTTIDVCTKIKSNAVDLTAKSDKALKKAEKLIGQPVELEDSNDELPHWDPGLRQAKLSSSQKRRLSSKGPHQPRLAKFPQREDIAPHKQRQFSANW